ncbi:cytochrome c oxidase cbb3-type subunit 4 [Litoreibacter ascidiaceicola]|uniref:Cytochrome c oxidase cbb3-type subunit 4 n=1 Tax=Litoreibacter ascidiaceicola TaxID=1486859 RepID=A0A1M4X9B4_9RHOB|nr:CcoQ/FixQ family Cbb3-type cytochrome c oxidase assembly chaperone [Litoreibacter ascidiaceicola]SHE90016.1 cytochrome c oxidase cbb3-type subunit 4 [Litoreibacter ascidiaceicola]
MDTYSFMRQLADSWVLLAMFAFFFGVILWAFRPGSRKMHDDISQAPFRNEDRPALDDKDAALLKGQDNG